MLKTLAYQAIRWWFLLCATSLFGDQVRVMQYNIHGTLGNIANNSSAGAAALARIINFNQPDVLLFCEVEDNGVAASQAALIDWVTRNVPYLGTQPGATFYVAVSSLGDGFERNAAISRYPILNEKTFNDGLRGLHSFQVQLPATNLQVFHAHLKCCSTGNSCTQKQAEAQFDADTITAWAATNSLPYIFAGDWNEDEENPECTLSASYHPITTIHQAGLDEFKPTTLDGEYRTWSTSPATPSIRFDYILPATNRVTPKSGYVFNSKSWAAHGFYTASNPQNLASDSATASDHYCVFADFDFTSKQVNTLQSIQTVFVILMENQNWSSIKGSASAPYINGTILPRAAHAEQYYNPPGLHPSLPNYLWLEAGTNFGIVDNDDPVSAHLNTTNHLTAQLNRAGLSWRAYQEDICGCYCPLTYTNRYAPRHNPFVYFDDVTNTNDLNSAYCTAHIRSYSQLANDLQNNNTARYNFITPNLCNDMHDDTGCATGDSILNGDNWLSVNLPIILNSQAYNNNGAVVVMWDEAAIGDGPIGMMICSPLAKPSGYANSIHYTHSAFVRTIQEIFNLSPLLGDAANSADLSDLFDVAAGQLSVSPASSLIASGTQGGPFTPSFATYTLSNAGNAALTWTASANSNWINLTATSGALAPGASASVTASINAAANTLPAGQFTEVITIANTGGGSGSTTRAVNLAVNSTNIAPYGFYDEFIGFATGNLVGQQGWSQVGTANALPLQVNNGKMTIPPGQLADNQDAYKNFSQTNGTVYYGLTLTIDSAVAAASPSYFAALYTGTNAAGFANFRLTAKSADAANATCVFGVRVTGQTGDPYTFGTLAVATGAICRIIVEAPSGGANMTAWLNPTSGDKSAQIPYAINPVGSGTPPTSVGAFTISQFGSSTAPNNGVSIRNVAISSSFATVYYALQGITPPAANFVANPREGSAPLIVTFSDSSTGTITSRSWDFGDGTGTNTAATTFTHTYAAGIYDITLVESGPAGVSTNRRTSHVVAFTPFQAWQIQYFSATNNALASPEADPDGDGHNNYQEFLAGTNPTNAAAALRIVGIAQEGDNIHLTWTMGSGRTNALQYSAGGPLGVYTDLFTISNTVGTITDYLHIGAVTSAPAGFYRVKLLP